MTGYGNFRYYVTTSDFTLGRMLQSLWRLNFLAAACCVVLNNSYMLYYICPMHTLFTLAVYGVLAVWPSANKSAAGVTVKLVASICLVAAVWEIPGVFDVVWAPLKPLLAYSDPVSRKRVGENGGGCYGQLR
jgi:N-acetylneuraminate 9-O-acetyltransferase